MVESNAVFLDLGYDWVTLAMKRLRLSPRVQLPWILTTSLPSPSSKRPISPRRSFPLERVAELCIFSPTGLREALSSPFSLRALFNYFPLKSFKISTCDSCQPFFVYTFITCTYDVVAKLLHERQWTISRLTSRRPLPEPNLPTSNPPKAPFLQRKSSKP